MEIFFHKKEKGSLIHAEVRFQETLQTIFNLWNSFGSILYFNLIILHINLHILKWHF